MSRLRSCGLLCFRLSFEAWCLWICCFQDTQAGCKAEAVFIEHISLKRVSASVYRQLCQAVHTVLQMGFKTLCYSVIQVLKLSPDCRLLLPQVEAPKTELLNQNSPASDHLQSHSCPDSHVEADVELKTDSFKSALYIPLRDGAQRHLCSRMTLFSISLIFFDFLDFFEKKKKKKAAASLQL